MLARFTFLVLIASVIGCSKPGETKPEPQLTTAPAPVITPSGPKQTENTGAVQPKAGGTTDRAAEERFVKYLDKVGGRYRRDDFGSGYIFSDIYLMGAKATDEGIREILLPTLHYIDFGETPVTDETLKQVGLLPHLSNLTVSSVKVTNAGVAHLAGNKALLSLNLAGCKQVTAEGIKQLSALPELIDIVLADTGVTSEDVKELKKAMPKWFIMK
jgi:hypothetical protein